MDKKKVTMAFINNCTMQQDKTGEPIYEFTDAQMGQFLDSLELKTDFIYDVIECPFCKSKKAGRVWVEHIKEWDE